MAKAKKKNPTPKLNLAAQVRQNILHGVLFLVLVVSLIGNTAYYRTMQQNTLVDKKNAGSQASFSIQPNQACNWQNFEKLADKFRLSVQRVRPHSIYGGIYEELPNVPIAQHICTMTTSADKEGEDTFAKVLYFLDRGDAKRYSQKELEHAKSWSPGTDDDMWRIWSYITIANGGKGAVEQAEAYTVKDDMIIHIQLPCTKLDDPAACDKGIRSYVDVMLKNLDEAYDGKNQNPFRNLTDSKY
jgi:hypothetical protein